jgi:uncharacterized membrane protein
LAETIAIAVLLSALVSGSAIGFHFWLRPWFARRMNVAWLPPGPGPAGVWGKPAISGSRLSRFAVGGALSVSAVAAAIALAISRSTDMAAALVFVPQFLLGLGMILSVVREERPEPTAQTARARRLVLVSVLLIPGIWLVATVPIFFLLQGSGQSFGWRALGAALLGFAVSQLLWVLIRVVAALRVAARR